MPHHIAGAALLLATTAPAFAQGWINDRTNNAIMNVDQITARYRDQISAEMARINRRPAPMATPTRAELQAMRTTDRWWVQRVATADGPQSGRPLRLSLAYLYDSAIINSAQIRVFGDLPAIRETLEAEVAGRYVPRAYGEGRAETINDPTRNPANTNGSQRLIQREQAAELGIRQRTITGGEITIGQRFWNVSSNSTDYAPNNQSRGRTFISVVQPLLRDSGVAYTRSLHEVARLDARVAEAEFRRQTESHLLDISRAYWGLYLARAVHLQRQRAVGTIRGLVGQIEGRAELGADPLLASRSRSALALREADLLRSEAAIRNAEARIRGLVNDPRFEGADAGTMLPIDATLVAYEPIPLQTVLERAVALRPEVQQVFLQHRAAVLREGQGQIEALPRFDVILEGNYGGRAADTWQWGQAWQDTRRNTDQPGGFFGLRIEIPLGTDDLRARADRRRLETRQIENQGRATLATIIAEAEVTLNEYNVAYREMAARAGAVRAAGRDLSVETDRWQQGVAGTGEGAANALERLLSAQERLTDAEERFAAAEVTFTIAFLALQRVQGTFTQVQNLEMRRIEDAARGPAFVFRRDTNPAPPRPTSSTGAVR
ncbi:TolC family protein [Roseomonas terrae]|uniref:TolC family protein n=1 Tax=Neoroseomonas terrae TaxID=424799 RepID=A0ABS5EG17_9PROT|nr:TolC family protein [Neoroseomonas terrae]MBR0649617.1 TolC family protein [Neoroseomonas terrae]